MELRSGYKQTEVGNIPNEWEVLALGKLASIERGKFTARPRNDPRYYGGNIPFIQTGDVTKAGGTISEYRQTLNATGLKVSKMFPRGTLFFTIAANIGDVGIANFATACPDSLVAMSPSSQTNQKWLLYELARRKAAFENIATHNAQLNINLEKLRPYLLPVPTAPEQRAIAEALSDVDELLGVLEALIVKKRAIKQGVMQQLLTGKIRLPGFSSEWKTSRIGDQLVYQRPDEYIVRTAEYTERGEVAVLTANKSFILGYTDETFGVCRAIPAIVFDDFTTDCKFATFPFKVKSSAIKLLRPRNDRVNLRYLFERMQLIRFPISDHKRHYIAEYQHIELSLPEYEEQTSIVSVLSEMDTEIAVLEARRYKTQAIKQGMMQQLLTGRIRLVKPQPAEAEA